MSISPKQHRPKGLTDLTEKIGRRLTEKFARAYVEELAAAEAEIGSLHAPLVLMGAIFPATAITLANAVAELTTEKMRAAVKSDIEKLPLLVDEAMTSGEEYDAQHVRN
jgi:hypothetical protein